MRSETLRIESLSKTIAGERVLNNLTFSVFRAETLSIFGANSTETNALLQLFSGNDMPDTGNIYVKNQLVTLKSPLYSRALGICTIQEKSSVLDNLSIAENIFLGRETRFFQNRSKLAQQAQIYMDAVGLGGLSPNLSAAALTPLQKAQAELATALASRPAILFFNKSSLFTEAADLNILQNIFQKFNSNQTSVVYMAQNIEHAQRLSDRIFLMGKGRSLGVFEQQQYQSEKFHALLRTVLPESVPARTISGGIPVLAVQALHSSTFADISFSVRQGEILGIYYVDETAKNELFHILSGLCPPKYGHIFFRGREFRPSSPAEAIAHGIAYAPSVSTFDGIFPNMTLKENLTLSSLKRISTLGWIRPYLENYYANELTRITDCGEAGLESSAALANAHTRQKILITRSAACNPQVLLLDEPFKGMDADAKEDILHGITALTRKSVAVLIASVHLKELESICNKVVFINKHI